MTIAPVLHTGEIPGVKRGCMQIKTHRCYFGVVDEQSMTTAPVLVGFRPVKYLVLRVGVCRLKRAGVTSVY